MKTDAFHNIGIDENHYTNALISIVEVMMCGKFRRPNAVKKFWCEIGQQDEAEDLGIQPRAG